MTPKVIIRKIGLLAVLLVFMAAQPSGAKIFEWYDTAQNRQDLLLLGFGELTMQVLDVSGNVEAFEDANPALSEDLSTNYRVSLFANGNATKNFLVNGAAIVDLLFSLRDRHGATLVLVTHSHTLAQKCDRVVRLRDGRIAGDHVQEAAE